MSAGKVKFARQRRKQRAAFIGGWKYLTNESNAYILFKILIRRNLEGHGHQCLKSTTT